MGQDSDDEDEEGAEEGNEDQDDQPGGLPHRACWCTVKVEKNGGSHTSWHDALQAHAIDALGWASACTCGAQAKSRPG